MVALAQMIFCALSQDLQETLCVRVRLLDLPKRKKTLQQATPSQHPPFKGLCSITGYPKDHEQAQGQEGGQGAFDSL